MIAKFGRLAPTLLVLAFLGCSSAPTFDTASVSGSVTEKGKPVASGRLMLSPVAPADGELAGPSAMAEISNGQYSIEAAVVGKHRVSLIPAGGMSDSEDDEGSEAFTSMTKEIEVKAGEENKIDIAF